MATGTATATVTAIDPGVSNFYCFGTITLSAGTDTYATGGLVLTWVNLPPSSSAPRTVYIQSIKSPNSGWVYEYNPGSPATQTSGKLQIFGGGAAANAAMAELAAAQALTTEATDVIFFEAVFQKL